MKLVRTCEESAQKEGCESSVKSKSISTRQSTMVHTRRGPYMTNSNKLGQTTHNTTTHYHIEGIGIVGFGVYGRIFMASLILVISGVYSFGSIISAGKMI